MPVDPSRKRFTVLSALLSLLLCTLPAQAEVLPIDVDIVTQSCNPTFCQNQTVRVSGSGTLVGRTPDGRYGVIVTCGHIFKAGKVKSIWVDGKVAQHYQFVCDDKEDIGVTFVEAPPQRWTPTPLADSDPTPGDPVTLSGFVGTSSIVISRPGSVLDVETGYASMQADEGLSGGPLLSPGRLDSAAYGSVVTTKKKEVTGVCTHDSVYKDERTRQRVRQTRFTPVSRIRTFMRSRSISISSSFPASAPLPPPEALVKSTPAGRAKVPEEASPKSSPSDTSLSVLEVRLASIEQKIAAISAGPPGPAGPSGPEGIAGPRGNPGPAGVVTVILKDAATGTVLDRADNVPSGSTVNLLNTKTLKSSPPPAPAPPA